MKDMEEIIDTMILQDMEAIHRQIMNFILGIIIDKNRKRTNYYYYYFVE